MKYKQSKNQKKYMYLIFGIDIIILGSLAIITLFDVGFITTGKVERLILGILFLSLTLLGVTLFFHLTKNVCGYFKGTIELTKDEIIYQDKNKEIKMKWNNVTTIYL